MKSELRAAFVGELDAARAAEKRGDAACAWHHLERAHVLSQAHPWPHVHVHALMLRQGLRRRDAHEVLGQLVRIIVAAPGSWTGKAPRGNTGGVNVGLFVPMPIPEDLKATLTRSAARA